MTVLVTGSAGHLGEALVRVLRARGRPVRGLDLLASPFTEVVGSAADRALVRQALAGVTGVLHAATLQKPHVATHSKEDFLEGRLADLGIPDGRQRQALAVLRELEAADARELRDFLELEGTETTRDQLESWLSAADWFGLVEPAGIESYRVPPVGGELLVRTGSPGTGA